MMGKKKYLQINTRYAAKAKAEINCVPLYFLLSAIMAIGDTIIDNIIISNGAYIIIVE